MEINNFKIISDQFIFNNKNDFYYVQLIKRKKDGHNINGNNRTRLIKSYCIKSKEDLLKREDEIIKLSNLFDARAYIHMTLETLNQ